MRKPVIDEVKFYHGTDFWMLNDRLDDEEIEKQLSKMKEQGVYSFIARTYVGLKSDYPGKEFKGHLKKIIDTAKKIDMKLFLQAGYMPEHVPDISENDKLKVIDYVKGDENADEGRIICKWEDYTFIEKSYGSFLNMFNKETVKQYLKVCYEDVWQEFSDEFGKTIISIWVDEPSYTGFFVPYPKEIDKLFFEKYGYSIDENIYKLYFDVDNFENVRYHFRTLLEDLFEENYFKQMSAWCKEHNLLATGHLMTEDTMFTQIKRAGACMPYYKYFDIPGIDILRGEMNWRKNAIEIANRNTFAYPSVYITTPIQCASVARQLGKERVLCEMYGVVTQDMTFRNQRYIFDLMAVHGINHRCVHGIFYSLYGRAKRTYPPHINYYQPYFDQYHKMYKYVENTARFISKGNDESDALVLHPLSSAFCEYTPIEEMQSAKNLTNRDNAFLKLLVDLSFSNVRFDLGDERIIEDEASIKDDNFVVGQISYKTIILPNVKALRKSTAEKINVFIKNGGRVICIGDLPHLVDGYEEKPFSENLIEKVGQDDLKKLLSLVKNTDYSFYTDEDDKSVLVRRKTDGDESFYFIFNADCANVKNAHLIANEIVDAHIIDAYSGETKKLNCTYDCGKTTIDFEIYEGSSVMLVTKKTSVKKEKNVKTYITQIHKFENLWQIERQNPNVLLLEFFSLKKGNENYLPPYPLMAVDQLLKEEDYKGEITLKYTFYSDEEFEGLKIALEDAALHKIVMNETKVETKVSGYYISRSFETINLPKCKKGKNILEFTRMYEPLEKAKSAVGELFTTQKGAELENMYLIGDFKLETTPEPERNGNVRLNQNMSLSKETFYVKSEIPNSGYPFYAGSISLYQDFEIDDDFESIYLELEEFNGCILNVYVNDEYCGDVCFNPYRIDISKSVKKGKNTLKLVLTNTLRNLLGPYHRPLGEGTTLFSGGYGNSMGPWSGDYKNDTRWFLHLYPDSESWTSSYMFVHFGVKNVKIYKEEKIKNDRKKK